MNESTTHARRNIEIKARLADFVAARKTAEEIATRHLGVVRQVDTYFHCKAGRLKLRQAELGKAQLIGYQRENEAAARPSDYFLIDIDQPDELRQCLATVLGVWKTVEKRREIFLHDNVRIHLDQVVGLGDFFELEAVLDGDHDEKICHRQIAELKQVFKISASELLTTSYSDML